MKQSSHLRIIASVFTLAICLATSSAQAVEALAEKATSERHQVVFQVSEGGAKTWNLVLVNAKNVQQDLGAQNVDVEIVVYGPGIDMLKLESTVANRVAEAISGGVRVIACENTMRGRHLSKDDMLPSIGYVPAGVIELMKKQKAGYAYIRP